MNKASALIAVIALFFAGLVWANTAVVTAASGTASVQTGNGPARTLRVGDQVRQGDTLFTARASSVVLKFDDGQIAALTANSRMTITAYRYEPSSGSGSVLLSLVTGGMRAITGLIGRRSPENVAYRAATATIGIRGTDVTIATDGGNVVVTVTEGAVSFTFNGRTIEIQAGEGVNARLDGTFQRGAADEILARISPELASAIGGIRGLDNAIRDAATLTSAGDGRANLTPSGPTNGVSSGGGGTTASGS
jgi:hypothetical protein